MDGVHYWWVTGKLVACDSFSPRGTTVPEEVTCELCRAVIERADTLPTERGCRTDDADRCRYEWHDYPWPRPYTMGWHRCGEPAGHKGDHKCGVSPDCDVLPGPGTEGRYRE